MTSQNKVKDINLLELYRIFLHYKKKILIITLIGFIISFFLLFFIIKPVFLSYGIVKTSTKVSGLSGILSSSIPDLGEFGDFAGAAGGSSAKELALYENILFSRRCIEGAIVNFKLNDEWEFKYMQQAVKHFREEVLSIKKDKIAGTMEIGIYHENPVLAKEIVDYFIKELNTINLELNVQDAKANREFIEARYNEVKIDLRKSEDSLKIFQDRFGVAPDLTIKAATTSMIQLEAEIKAEEVKYELLTKIVTTDQPEAIAQREKIIALKKQMEKIRTENVGDDLLSLKGAPDVALNYLRLTRNMEIQNKILSFIVPMYEQAKIEEKKEMPSVVILDPPVIPEVKAKPKRIIYISIFTFLTFIFSYLGFFIYYKWNEFKNSIPGH